MSPVPREVSEDLQVDIDIDMAPPVPLSIPQGKGQGQGQGSKKMKETKEEKLARRKEEREKRKQHRLKKNNSLLAENPVLKGIIKKFNKVFEEEDEFVLKVQQALPEVRNPSLLEAEEGKMTDVLLEDSWKDLDKKAKFHEQMKARMKGDGETGEMKATTHEELKKRLQAKIEALRTTPNEKKRLKKERQKEKKRLAKEGLDSSKKFISKANPNLKNQGQGSSQSHGQSPLPLRKKPVVKENGEIVFSKFDFISTDGDANKGKKSDAGKLLKKVEKIEKAVVSLEQRGSLEKAVGIVEKQKWESALKRADGEKVRDDATLLRKTVKKQEKKKQVSKKKWGERLEKVKKLKDAKQEKRMTNISKRKEEKTKKILKGKKKKGRVA